MGRECRQPGDACADALPRAGARVPVPPLATLRTDIDLFESVDQLQWKGPTPAFAPLAARLEGTKSSDASV